MSIFEKLYTYPLIEVQLTLAQLAAYRIYENEEKYNYLLEQYFQDVQTIVEEFLPISQQKRQLTYKIIKNENLLEGSDLIDIKKKIVTRKKTLIIQLERLKIECKLVPFLKEIFVKDMETFTKSDPRLANLNSESEIVKYCKQNSIRIADLIDDDLKVALSRLVNARLIFYLIIYFL